MHPFRFSAEHNSGISFLEWIYFASLIDIKQVTWKPFFSAFFVNARKTK